MTIPRCVQITTWTLLVGFAFWMGVASSTPVTYNVEFRRIQVPVTTAAQIVTTDEISRICKARERSAKVKQL